MTLYAQAVSGRLRYNFTWAEVIPSNATGTGTIEAEYLDTVAQTSTIEVDAIPHGGHCAITAKATLSNGEVVPDQQLVIRGFNP